MRKTSIQADELANLRFDPIDMLSAATEQLRETPAGSRVVACIKAKYKKDEPKLVGFRGFNRQPKIQSWVGKERLGEESGWKLVSSHDIRKLSSLGRIPLSVMTFPKELWLDV